ncbi:hypothetical protein [Sphingobacterium cavernae]|uniref:hypothetical protein n=1 Tax=Sphingobacterium cavernae TaxID=2592657 RepID=UPI0012301FD2|nr:hypothetical protein [Sphingobacterium cavernae]
MRIRLVQYILSIILLTCLAYKTSSTLLHAVSHEIEFLEHFVGEKETKEVEKLYEIEVFFQSHIGFFFSSNSRKLDFFDPKKMLPFRHFHLHYPPPNSIA